MIDHLLIAADQATLVAAIGSQLNDYSISPVVAGSNYPFGVISGS